MTRRKYIYNIINLVGKQIFCWKHANQFTIENNYSFFAGRCALRGLVTVPVKITAVFLPCVPRFNPGTLGLFISSTG